MDVAGTYVLEDDATAKEGCVGQGVNAGLGTSTKVTLSDTADHVVSTSTLSTGDRENGSCTFRFRFAGVSDELKEYSVTVAGHGRTTVSAADLSANHWEVELHDDAPTTDVTGTLELDDFETAYDDCVGAGGYSDIGEGTDVVIRDQSGRILGSGSLDAGTSDDDSTCTYDFTISGVRQDQEQYALEISHRGGITSSRSDLEDDSWAFSATLGD